MPGTSCIALCFWEPLAPPAQHAAASVRFAFASGSFTNANLMALLWLSLTLCLLQPVGTFSAHTFRTHAGPGPQEDLQSSGIKADTGTLT